MTRDRLKNTTTYCNCLSIGLHEIYSTVRIKILFKRGCKKRNT